MIPLNENHHFKNDETVAMISREYYDKLKANMTKIKDVKKDLEIQLENYKNIICEMRSILKKGVF